MAVGLILGIVAFWVLILPTKLNSANQENRNLQLSHSEDISKKNVMISDMESKISNLEKELEAKNEAEAEDKKKEVDQKDSFQVIKDNIPNTAYGTLCEEAAKAINENDYPKAISMCNVALQIQEGEEAYYYLGKAYLGNQDEEKAKTAFKSLKDNYPESSHIDEISDYLTE